MSLGSTAVRVRGPAQPASLDRRKSTGAISAAEPFGWPRKDAENAPHCDMQVPKGHFVTGMAPDKQGLDSRFNI